MAPLCFVLMPFGQKPDPTGGEPIDFDQVYGRAIGPAIEAAGLVPLRADQERAGGIIHKALFERLVLCDFAIADLTCANANVFYELGVRHAVRPATTVMIFGKRHALPFDVKYVRALPYDLGDGNRFAEPEASALRDALSQKLRDVVAHAGDTAADSPLFQLLSDYGAPDIARLKTDTFRDRIEYSEARKRALARARDAGDLGALRAIESDLGNLGVVELGVLVDLLLSYRAVSAWAEMVALYERLPGALQRAVLVQEQLGLALNRLGRRDEALRVLEQVVQERGPSSETCSLIGRVYKDLWKATRATHPAQADGYLRRAIAAYVHGFEADFRDAYPGINAVTLLDIAGRHDQQRELLPVVEYAARRSLGRGSPDYWDRATLLELAVLASAEPLVAERLGDALAAGAEGWMRESTASNLAMIRQARVARGQQQDWLDRAIRALDPSAVLDPPGDPTGAA
jgi:tetratricopeptide (TPR) repeat protein